MSCSDVHPQYDMYHPEGHLEDFPDEVETTLFVTDLLRVLE
jgi:hypothetical protein